jgi:AraC-like DNA-binding protein
MSNSAAYPVVCESVKMPRFQLAVVAAGGADASQLARDAQLPGWALADDQAMIHPRHALRLWELAEHALQDSAVGLTAAVRLQPGELDLYDYLFSTSATLRDGFALCGQYLHLLTTNGRLRIEAESEHETTYSYSFARAADRGAELALQVSVAVFCARARAGTGQPVAPVRVEFTQAAPRLRRTFTETLGTRRVDFGAPVTTFTFRARDLAQPMLGADPVLARILRAYAASLPPPAVVSWHDHFHRHLSDALDDGAPSLQALARRLAVSTRTLQRRLAEHGTTWRAELDDARQRSARHVSPAGPQSMSSLARRLGYTDTSSLRRARRRWDGEATEDDGATG